GQTPLTGYRRFARHALLFSNLAIKAIPEVRIMDLQKLVFGKLTWESIPYHEPILVATFAAVAVGGIALLYLISRYRLWGYLWRDWITSIDHKKIGIMYMILGVVMLL